jgi:endogenous inhibitor of DNA gyrase (YacG/DUF329 family)
LQQTAAKNVALSQQRLNSYIECVVIAMQTSQSLASGTQTHDTKTQDKTYPCPQCQKPTTWHQNPHKPFCSARCKLIDLGAWASETYKIGAEHAPFSDELDNFTH